MSPSACVCRVRVVDSGFELSLLSSVLVPPMWVVVGFRNVVVDSAPDDGLIQVQLQWVVVYATVLNGLCIGTVWVWIGLTASLLF